MKRPMLSLRTMLILFAAATSLLFASAASATTYYVSPSGDDNNSGEKPSTPWQTVARVNGTNLQPGDSVLFLRGGEWHESLVAPTSGAVGNPITFADYGTGAKPKFWGSVVLPNANWVKLPLGFYLYQISTPVYSVLANHTFFNFTFGQPAANFDHGWTYNYPYLIINSPDSDPRYDGRVYTAVQRDDVVYSNYQSHLVFNNLVVDESARYDDNGGYGFRVMGSTDVQMINCEAYRAGKHHFGVINSTGFVGTNLIAAYAAPGQESTGGASAFVSYGDSSTGLYSQTSEWHNVSVSNMDDPEDNNTYYAFIMHGATLTSTLLDHLQSYGANVSIGNGDNPSGIVRISGGLIQNARLEVAGTGAVVDGMELSGPQATVDIQGDNAILQNMLIHGTNLGSAWYQTAVLSRGTNNTLRFSTIDMDPNSGTNTALATTNVNGGLNFYGNALLAPARSFALWDFNLSQSTIAQANFNFYRPQSKFAWYVGGAFQWNDLPFPRWQNQGFDLNSQTGNPKLADETNGNFRPAAGSPLIDAAPLPSSLLSSVPADFAGSPRLQGAAFDIGAFEGVSTVAQPVATTVLAQYGDNILSAHVSAQSGTPSGSISFFDGSSLLNTVTLVNGGASTSVALDSTLAHSLTAVYSGDASYAASTSPAITINAVPPPPPVTTPPSPPVTPPSPPVNPPVTTPPPPVTVPQGYPISLTYPADGQTVSGTIVATSQIPQTLDSAGTVLMLDGQRLDYTHQTNAPYNYVLDTTGLKPGAHTLQVWAHDISNAFLLSNTVTINVSN